MSPSQLCFPLLADSTLRTIQEEAVPISDVKDTAWLIREWERARVEAKRSERWVRAGI